jgi:hypothetical protein
MNPSPTLTTRRAATLALVVVVAVSVALLIAMPILDGRGAEDDRADAAAPSASPSTSTPPASTKKAPPDRRVTKPVRLSDGSVQMDGNVLIPASQASADEIDLRVFSPAYGRPWTGPWPMDFSKMRVDHTPRSVVFTLFFPELNIREGWQNDVIRIYVDSKENPPGPLEWPAMHPAAEREVDFVFDPERADGAVFRHRGDIPGSIRDCKFEASLHEAADSVSVRAPRRCFDYPDRLRARAELQAPREGWEGWDTTEWTGFAVVGRSAAIRDPAREWRHPVVN